jgi:dissimilatory sulfite reductase (desulfoviridin) alpha/beta subunit
MYNQCGGLNMKLTDLVKDVVLVAGLALPVYGCGDDVTNNYEGGARLGSGGSTGTGGYTCETACNKAASCCRTGEAHCYDDDTGEPFQIDIAGCINYCTRESMGPPCSSTGGSNGEFCQPKVIECMSKYCDYDAVPDCDPYF